MNEKILVVDDVFDNIKVIINYLKDLNYELYFATNGEKAIQSIETVTPDLILMDVMMPVLNGLDTVTRIKKDERYKDIPVIFITALSEPEDISKGFQVGGVDYITKPIKSIELLARIKIHLQLEEHRKLLEKIVVDEKNEIDYLKLTQKQLVESEKMASIGGLVAGVANQIKTPLGSSLTEISHILLITENMIEQNKRNNNNDVEGNEYLETIQKLASSILNNLNKTDELIINFKRVAVDQSSDRKRKVKIRSYMEGLILSVDNIRKETNIDISLHCSEKLEVFTYPGGLYQILTNLIMNSFQHAFDKEVIGNIDITIEQNGNSLNLLYKDDGKGIKTEILNQIFEPFFTTDKKSGRIGLGLNIVYSTVLSTFNGTVNCTSELSKGTSFNIVLSIDNDN